MKLFFKILKFIFIPIILYFSCFWFYASEYLTDPANTYQIPGYDQDGSTFIKQIWADNTAANNFQRHTDKIQFPFGWSLMGIPYGSIIDNLVIYPVNWLPGTSIIFWHSIGVVAIYLLAPFFAFILCLYLTKYYWGSLIGGYIYGFVGLNLWYGGGNDPLAHFQFVPLFFLSLFYFFNNQNWRNFILVVLASTLNNITVIYWGWFIYLSVFFIFSFDYLFFKKYIQSLKKYVLLLIMFGFFSGVLTLLTNLGFFYYSYKYISPEESSKIERSLSNTSFQFESLERHFVPLDNSLWSNFENSYDLAKSYVITAGILLTIILLLSTSSEKKEKSLWVIYVSIGLIIFYVLLSSSQLQYLFRTIIPSITAYNRTYIFLNLFLGILIALAFKNLSNSKSKYRKILISGLLLFLVVDVINPDAFFTISLKKEMPAFVTNLALKSKNPNESMLFYPWECGRYGFVNMFFQSFHHIPLANPYMKPQTQMESLLCREVNNYGSAKIKDYIRLFNVKYLLGYKNNGLPFDQSVLEENLKECIQKRESYISSPNNAFYGSVATIYTISDQCREGSVITESEISNDKAIIIDQSDNPESTINSLIKKSPDQRLVKISQSDASLTKIEPVAFNYKKISDDEYNIEILENPKTGQLFTINHQFIDLNKWAIYEVNDLDSTLKPWDLNRKVNSLAYTTNLYQVSIYSDALQGQKKYKLVFIDKYINYWLLYASRTISVLLFAFATFLIYKEYKRYKS